VFSVGFRDRRLWLLALLVISRSRLKNQSYFLKVRRASSSILLHSCIDDPWLDMDESQIAEAVRASLFFVNHSLILMVSRSSLYQSA
jgi:hypothetical protein